jgi:pimeloyl-ACP methyl ester carboxylesterase
MGGSSSLRRRRLKRAALVLLAPLFFGILILAGFRIAAAFRETGAAAPKGTVFVSTPYGRVAATVSGPADGAPILIVHGTAAWSGFWRDVAAHLAARGRRVIAIDLPPFGWSDRDPQARYDRVTQSERLSAVVSAVGPKPATVLGHSFGAGAATELALRHPGQLRSLVLVDAALGSLDPDGGDGAVARALRFPPLAQGLVAATITNPWATGPLLRSFLARKEAAAPWLGTLEAPMRREGSTAAYAAWLPSLFATNDGALSRTRRGLAGIRVPVALIWGEADTVTPLEQGRQIAALTRARSTAVLPGVGHIPHIEDPSAFLAALDAALDAEEEGK